MRISNPILPGFHADPSICRVGDTYYVATSTFEWYPGVEINASTDLQNWQMVSRPLARATLLDMRGEPDSCGVWAPCLSYADGLFWLVYTDVKRYNGNYKDTHNYLTTAPAIDGPWSDPVFLNSSGFDASLFHDDDGRKWHINMDWDYRGSLPGHSYFGGVVLQEYDHESGKLFGPIKRIFTRTEKDCTEGPHLFKRDGWYYLTLAEGGTGYDHVVTYARSRNIDGPYETSDKSYLITAADTPDAPLQRTGHGQYVEAPDGTFWHTFLCSRPLPGTRRSPLGREAAIAQVEWSEDGWLTLDTGTYDVPADGYCDDAADYSFGSTLHPDFQWLRTPEPDRLFDLNARDGHIRMIGRESIGSLYESALIARRQTGWRYSAECALDCDPRDYKTQAGLTAYYNSTQFYYLHVSRDDQGQAVLGIQSCAGAWPEGYVDLPLGTGYPIPEGPVELGVDVDLAALQFRWRVAGGTWAPIGPVLDASILSDEGGRGEHATFTGAFVGIAAQDNSGTAWTADFSRFAYKNRKEDRKDG